MSYSKEAILSAADQIVVDDKLPSRAKYDWLDLVGIPQRPEVKRNLYFASHSEGEGGWDNGFDRRTTLSGVFRDKGWDLVTEDKPLFNGSNYLQVTSLGELSSRLYESARETSSPFVVGVTGSVGKTTTIAFLEHLAQESGINVVRFFSKRLSPLSVMCHYVNRVDKNTALVVMEYSVYLHNHVSELASLLPPDVAFLLNIYDTHINPGMFESKKDIFDSKTKIRQEKTLAYVNRHVIDGLGVSLPVGWNSFELTPPPFWNPYMPPTLRTIEMFSTGRVMASNLGITEDILNRAFMTFRPEENRIVSCIFGGTTVFFHGETSGGGRLWSWFETIDGSYPWLFVEETNFASEDPRGFRNLLEKVFSSDKTIVLDTPDNRQKIMVKANFVDAATFGSLLRNKARGYIVYHKALSVRQKDFNPEKYLRDKWGLG